MKRLLFDLAAFCLLVCPAGMSLVIAAEPSVQVSPVWFEMPKSVFIPDLPNGKDPFFPESTRRMIDLARKDATNAVASADAVTSQLLLKGISTGRTRRTALINSATLMEGESAKIKIDGVTYVVQCLEIRDKSVVLTLDGGKTVRELTLRRDVIRTLNITGASATNSPAK